MPRLVPSAGARDHAAGQVASSTWKGDHHRGIGVVREAPPDHEVAVGHDATPVERACSSTPATLTSTSTVDDAVRLMRDRSLRRVPVVGEGRAVGIVTLGDLAIEQGPGSALSDISAAPPNS